MSAATPPTPSPPLRMSREVGDAIASQQPVVGLETAVLTHGLPRESWRVLQRRLEALGEPPSWLDADAPLHLAALRAMEAAVRASQAVPAITAIIEGEAWAGLDQTQLAALAADPRSRKIAARDICTAVAQRASGGTTVSASMALCASAAIRVLATGGIGGVHRGWALRPDVSADLPALARHPLCVVSSGAKSILDLPATIEALETLSIPVVGWRCDAWPRFVHAPDPTLPLDIRLDDAPALAELCRVHWELGGGAVLVVQPADPRVAISGEADEGADAAPATSPRGAAATPELLDRLMRATRGGSLRANVEILRANAMLAAQLAVAFAPATRRT